MLTYEQVYRMVNSKMPVNKQAIKETAAHYGIPIPNCSCRNKWNDTLIQLALIMKPTSENYIYNKPNDFHFKGKTFNNNTSKEDIIWLKTSYPTLFKTLYAPDNNIKGTSTESSDGSVN